MRRAIRLAVASVTVAIVIGGALLAQEFGQGFGQPFGGRRRPRFNPSTSEIPERNGTPTWEVDKQFKSDLFTFVRIKYSDGRYGGGRYGRKWRTDFPDSDVNFSYRLQQLTSLKVDPNGKILELTDDALFDYPFIYMLEVGQLEFSEDEVVALRKYLLNGGFLMVDDFWGGDEYDNFYREIKRVFPDREPVDLDISHPIFHCVYDIKKKPQIPGIEIALSNKGTGITTERPYDPQGIDPDYKAFFDDKGRMLVMICHNTDNGDGWEREGEDPWYFHEFSEKQAYPMGINIVFYAMTH